MKIRKADFMLIPASIKIAFAIILMLLSVNLRAQNNCTQSLKIAEKKFEAGLLREIPDVLAECLQSRQFTREELSKAFKLLTITYLYLDDSLSAENNFYKLLKNFPDYQLNPEAEPAELINLYKSYRTLSLFSIGIQAGTNLTQIAPFNTFGVDNLSQKQEKYHLLPGFSVGIKFELPVSRRLFLSSGPSLDYFHYKYQKSLNTTSEVNENGIPYNFGNVQLVERQTWLNIPLLLGASLGSNNIRQYFFGGASAGMLLSAQADASRKFVYAPLTGNEVKGVDINIGAQRNRLNYWGILGTGLTVKSGLHHVDIEASYEIGLLNMVNSENRFSNSQLINRFGYVDNDVKANIIRIRAAYMISRYKPKKVKINEKKN